MLQYYLAEFRLSPLPIVVDRQSDGANLEQLVTVTSQFRVPCVHDEKIPPTLILVQVTVFDLCDFCRSQRTSRRQAFDTKFCFATALSAYFFTLCVSNIDSTR